MRYTYTLPAEIVSTFSVGAIKNHTFRLKSDNSVKKRNANFLLGPLESLWNFQSNDPYLK